MIKHSSLRIETSKNQNIDQLYTPSLTDLPSSIPSYRNVFSQQINAYNDDKKSLINSLVSDKSKKKVNKTYIFSNFIQNRKKNSEKDQEDII